MNILLFFVLCLWGWWILEVIQTYYDIRDATLYEERKKEREREEDEET